MWKNKRKEVKKWRLSEEGRIGYLKALNHYRAAAVFP